MAADDPQEPYVVLDRDLRIVGISDACARERDLRPHDVVGRPVAEVFAVESPPRRPPLLESEAAVLRTMVDCAPIRGWVKDAQGRYVTANKPFADYLRVPGVEHMVGRDDLELQPVDLAEGYRADDAQVMATGQPKYVEEQAFDGTAVHWIETWKTPLVDERGEVVGTVGFCRDNTQRRATEERLRLHSAILESLFEGVALVRMSDQVIVFVNAQFEQMFGYAPGEMVGLPVSAINAQPDSTPEEAAAAITQTLEETGRWTGELRNVRKDGSHLWSHASIRVLDLPQLGRVAVTVQEDISRRRESEQRQHEAENLFRASFESAASGMALVSAQRRFLDANPALCRLFGYSRDELRELTVQDVVHPEEVEKSLQQMRELASGSGSILEERRYQHKDGHTVHTMLTASPVVDGEGRVLCFFAHVQDITERKRAEAEKARLEAQVRESQKMESLGTLAGGLAHDFNNLLAMILGNLKLAKQDVGAEHPAFVSLDEIDRASRRAKDLVGQVLAFARREKPQRKVLSLRPLVVDSASLVRATLPAIVDLRVECDDDAPPVVADASQVGQIVLNLCANAAHALQEGVRPGHITLSLRAVRREGERYACLSVADDGHGIDEAIRERIFDPFFTTKAAGTGLGLSVVHSIVQAHEAFLEVESVVGEGTTIRVLFPAAEAALDPSPHPAAVVSEVLGADQRVLFVDDEDAIVYLMKRLLGRRGFKVTGCTSPAAALALVRAAPDTFDLAVTDFNMPQMSGLDVARSLVELAPTLPVLLASGYVTDELRTKAHEAGVREVIYKPDVVDDLCDAVARCFSSLQAERPLPET